MSKLFIFDFDGTIADTMQIVKDYAIDFSKEENIPTPNVEEICVGYSNPDNHDFGWNVDKAEQKKLMYKIFDSLAEKMGTENYMPPLFPNTVETIKKLYEQGNKIALCTAREKAACLRILKHYNLLQYFSELKTRDDLKNGFSPKPAPEMANEIREKLSFSKENAFIIGDTEVDIIMAKNCEVNSIGVSWGYHSVEKLRNSGANRIIYNFNELLEKYHFVKNTSVYFTQNYGNDHLSVLVILRNEKGQFVLARHKRRGGLELPGGHKDNDETIEEAARRESLEEVGAYIKNIKIHGYYVLPDGHKTIITSAEVDKMVALSPDVETEDVDFHDEIPSDDLSFKDGLYDFIVKNIY